MKVATADLWCYDEKRDNGDGDGEGEGRAFSASVCGNVRRGRARVGRVTEELDGMQDVARIVATI